MAKFFLTDVGKYLGSKIPTTLKGHDAEAFYLVWCVSAFFFAVGYFFLHAVK